MKIVGVIAEYNPFHQGHAFHLAKARALTGADHVIAVMSGNYVQRGVPAMFDKYTRAEAALRNGADLVLELPPWISTGSAEYFASGTISLLLGTGIVTDLCFGSECGDLALLRAPARILASEPEAFQKFIKQELRTGIPYPRARALALMEYDSSISPEILEEPNNLLGLEYLKALERLGNPIQAHTIRRAGSAYHETSLEPERTASASGIRTALLGTNGAFTPELRRQIPSSEIYGAYEGKTPITEDAFSLLLLEKLRRLQGTSLKEYFDVTEELSNRIWNCLDDFSSFSQFTDLLKTRNLTRTAVSRALLHILLDIRADRPADCLRVLGFRQDSAGLLKMLQDSGRLPVVTNLAGTCLPENWLYADRIYESVRSLLHGRPYQNEYRRKLLVIP